MHKLSQGLTSIAYRYLPGIPKPRFCAFGRTTICVAGSSSDGKLRLDKKVYFVQAGVYLSNQHESPSRVDDGERSVSTVGSSGGSNDLTLRAIAVCYYCILLCTSRSLPPFEPKHQCPPPSEFCQHKAVVGQSLVSQLHCTQFLQHPITPIITAF
jgi:hypothetical protein